MSKETNSMGKAPAVLQHIDPVAGKLILNMGGEIQEIHSQLSDLKALLTNKQAQKI